MFVKYVSLMPEILLLLNVAVMQVVYIFRASQTPKTFATISRVFIIAALAACVIFYNVSFDKALYVNTAYTTFFKGLVLFCGLALNFFACKWFLGQGQSSLGYYRLSSLILLGCCMAISGRSFAVLVPALLLCFAAGWMMMNINFDAAHKRRSFWGYAASGAIFAALLLGGTGFLCLQSGGWSYAAVLAHYQTHAPQNFEAFAVGSLIAAVLYMMGAAPFQFGQIKIVRYCVLPVAAFFQIVPVICGAAVLLILLHNTFAPFAGYLQKMLLLCGAFSIATGVIGANSSRNIRHVFACTAMFNIGIVLLMFSHAGELGLQSGIIYFLVYLLTMLGVLTCFYGMRSHGEYMRELDDLSGFSKVKPYVAAGLLFFIVSLLGVPPLLGMLGNLTLVNSLLDQKSYYLIAFIAFMLVWLSHGLLEVVKSIYFDMRRRNFDRVDKAIYFCLFLNAALILTVVLKPRYLMYDIEEMVQSFLKQV